MKNYDIHIRDPFVIFENGRYYMYGTRGKNYGIRVGGFDVYESSDLVCWSGPRQCFDSAKFNMNTGANWAPEVHKYNGKYYMLASFPTENEKFGTYILKSSSPLGPFEPLTGDAITPHEQSCIDGTLFVNDGIPYIFYSHDWPDNYVADEGAYVGEICAAQLSADLTQIVGEPWVVFASNESLISKATPDHNVLGGQNCVRYGSDAPFVQKLSDGSLLLTWSPYLNDNYVVLSAVSQNGNIKGPWKHITEMLFDKDGGHAMFFDTRDGKRCMCLHSPERKMFERAHFFEVKEIDGLLRVIKELEV